MANDTRVPQTRSPFYGDGLRPPLMPPHREETSEQSEDSQELGAGVVGGAPVQGAALVASAVDNPRVQDAARVASAVEAPLVQGAALVASAVGALPGADVAPLRTHRLGHVLDMIDERDEDKKTQARALKREEKLAQGPKRDTTQDEASVATPQRGRKRITGKRHDAHFQQPAAKIMKQVATADLVKYDKPTVANNNAKSQYVSRTGYRGVGQSKCFAYGEGKEYHTSELAKEAAETWLAEHRKD